MSAAGFCEIGARTHFSFLEGASSAEDMVAQASRLGLSGLGIADRNSVAGVVRAHSKAKAILETYEAAMAGKPWQTEEGEELLDPVAVQPGARLVFCDGTPDILAFPVNRKGWGHLCRLLSAGNLRSDKGTCTLYAADLIEWQEELILVVVPDRRRRDPAGWQHLEDFLASLKTCCPGRAYLALSPHYDGYDRLIFAELAVLAEKFHLPLIATNEPLYHVVERRPLSDVVTAIRHHVTIAEAGLLLAANAERHLKDCAELQRIFRAYPEAIVNTGKLFRRLSFSLDELGHLYPIETGDDETPIVTLKRLTWEGFARRFPGGASGAIVQQIGQELKLIEEKDYPSYFLTIRNIMQFARSKGILCQGRGSAANSTVCYCLEITDVDPRKMKLLFARFLSTERHEPPDIDVDFEHARRQEVIAYIYDTYGKEYAGLAAAVTTYRTRSAGREVAKAFGLSEDVQSALVASVWGWWTHGFSDEQAKAAGLDTQDRTTKQVLEYTGLLMAFPRHLTQHVGGFVITPDRLDEIVPIMNTASEDRFMIEWDKDDLDRIGLFKIDVLALGMLTCLGKAFDLLQLHYDRKKSLADLGHAVHADEGPVYDMICRADTIGVFQIESRAQMSMLPRLRPREFYDLVIEVAIVRPGPIQGDMVHPYLKRREEWRTHKKQVEFPKPELKAILERTLGVPLFQEQAMQIAITAAGFEPAEADRLRRAMATFKRTGTITYFHDKMIAGMTERGYDREFAERCFNQIKGFSEYGFPESHAASFALLVYASSWFKTYYPDIFCVAMLNSQPMGFYAPAQLVRDAREHGVVVRPVDINHSDWDCLLEDDGFDPSRVDRRHASMRSVILTEKAVRLGFRQVKGVSENEMRACVARRGAGYGSVRDLWLRSGLSRSAIERLADADAFHSIGLERRDALWAVRALDEKAAAEHLPLFDRSDTNDLQREPDVILPAMLPGEQVIEDYRALSLSLKAHPAAFMRQRFSQAGVTCNRDLATAPKGRRVSIAGLVLVRQRPGSANGVIFMTIEDETGVANAIVWNKVFNRYRPVVMGARVVLIRGRLQRENGVIHVVAEQLEDMTPLLSLLQQGKASDVPPTEGLQSTAIALRRHGQGNESGYERGDERQKARRAAAEAAQVMPKGRNFH